MKLTNSKLAVLVLVLSSLLSNSISMNGRCAPSIDMRIANYLVFIRLFGFSPVKYQSRLNDVTLEFQLLRTDTLRFTASKNSDTVEFFIKTCMISSRQFAIEDLQIEIPKHLPNDIKEIVQSLFERNDTVIFDDNYLSCKFNDHKFTIVPNSFDYFAVDNKRKYKPINNELIHQADSLLKDSTVLNLVDSSSVSLVKRVLELVDNSTE